MKTHSLLFCNELKSVSGLVHLEDASSSPMGVPILVLTYATHIKCTELPLEYPGETHQLVLFCVYMYNHNNENAMP